VIFDNDRKIKRQENILKEYEEIIEQQISSHKDQIESLHLEIDKYKKLLKNQEVKYRELEDEQSKLSR